MWNQDKRDSRTVLHASLIFGICSSSFYLPWWERIEWITIWPSRASSLSCMVLPMRVVHLPKLQILGQKVINLKPCGFVDELFPEYSETLWGRSAWSIRIKAVTVHFIWQPSCPHLIDKLPTKMIPTKTIKIDWKQERSTLVLQICWQQGGAASIY